MNLPLAPYGATNMAGLLGWLRVFAASVAAGFAKEHKADGTHNWGGTAPAFDANRFAGDGTITWTVASADVASERYYVLGKMLVWHLMVATSTTGGTASTTLYVSLPNSYVPAVTKVTGVAYANENGTIADAIATFTAGSRRVAVTKKSGANWSNTLTDTLYIYLDVMVEIQ